MATSNPGSYLNPKHLEELISRYQNTYRQAKPFPHVIIDNFLPTAVLDRLLDELLTMDSLDWQQLNGNTESRIASRTKASRTKDIAPQLQTGGITQRLLDQLNAAIFINFLEALTGAEGLFANPQVEISGVQSLEQNKPFKIPIEFDRPTKPLDRKLTFLIYLNKSWKEEYGGHLELWNAEMTCCEKKVLPIFNRCVIFSTTEVSYYGHPEPLNCPDHETRKILALYYSGKARSAAMPLTLSRPSSFHPSSGEIMGLEKQPIEVSVKTFIKTFIKRLIPALNQT